MTILDTNVLSELMKLRPRGEVVAWVNSQSSASLYTTSVSQAEILLGLMLLPRGRRRAAFEGAVATMFEEDFAGRVLAFDTVAALTYAHIASERRRAGRPISQFDAQIAAIGRASGASIATRTVADFEGCGVKLIDPWNA